MRLVPPASKVPLLPHQAIKAGGPAGAERGNLVSLQRPPNTCGGAEQTNVQERSKIQKGKIIRSVSCIYYLPHFLFLFCIVSTLFASPIVLNVGSLLIYSIASFHALYSALTLGEKGGLQTQRASEYIIPLTILCQGL